MDFLDGEQEVWAKLKNADRPIVMYGMGLGAEKILAVFDSLGIKVDGFFASDDFVRGHFFKCYPVLSYKEAEIKFPDFICILSFASSLPVVMDRIIEISKQHTLYAPDVPVSGGGLFNLEYLEENIEQINKAFELFEDKLSKDTFINTIKYKISGKLEYLVACQTPKNEAFSILKIGENEDFVDLGAYNGDTIDEFLMYSGNSFKSITAVEPDIKNYNKLIKRVEELKLKNANCYNLGIWNQKDTIIFDSKAGRNSSISKNGRMVSVDSVDNLMDLKRVSYIKIDVEGAELKALVGSEKTIKKYKPKLNVAAYHRNEDIFLLPIYINQQCPEYKLFLRHHPYFPAWDTNIYAV